jgi:hypothetical protein
MLKMADDSGVLSADQNGREGVVRVQDRFSVSGAVDRRFCWTEQDAHPQVRRPSVLDRAGEETITPVLSYERTAIPSP